MTTLREAAQMALDALDIACRKYGDVGGAETDWGKWDAAMTALTARLAQPEQEPVAWVKFKDGEITHAELTDGSGVDMDLTDWTPLYTAPQQEAALQSPQAAGYGQQKGEQIKAQPEQEPVAANTGSDFRKKECLTGQYGSHATLRIALRGKSTHKVITSNIGRFTPPRSNENGKD